MSKKRYIEPILKIEEVDFNVLLTLSFDNGVTNKMDEMDLDIPSTSGFDNGITNKMDSKSSFYDYEE